MASSSAGSSSRNISVLKSAEIYRRDRAVEILERSDSLSGEAVLLGFALNLRRIWLSYRYAEVKRQNPAVRKPYSQNISARLGDWFTAAILDQQSFRFGERNKLILNRQLRWE